MATGTSFDPSLRKQLLEGLECPICSKYMSPPILQCKTGHSICNKCRSKMICCPMCKGDFSETRNLSLEGICMMIKQQCQYSKLGCNKELSMGESENHEKVCFFRPFKCAIETCVTLLTQNDVLPHWDQKGLGKLMDWRSTCHIKMLNVSNHVNMIRAYGQLFWYKRNVVNDNLFFVVQYLGFRPKATDYYYEVEVFKPGYPNARLILGDYCQMPDTEHEQLFTTKRSPSISLANLDRFIGKDNIIIHHVTVFEVSKPKPVNKTDRAECGSNDGKDPKKLNPKLKPKDKKSI